MQLVCPIRIMRLCPGEELAVVLMCNTEGTRHEELAADLLNLLLHSGATTSVEESPEFRESGTQVESEPR